MTHRILMVDHSSTFRAILKNSLEGYDCDFFEADNGKNGLSLAVSKRPDLIILDANMPVMSGEDLLRQLKVREKLKDIPVVMVTTESEQSKVLEFAKLGINGYFVKPLKADELIKKIKELIDLQPEKEEKLVKDNSGLYFTLKGDILFLNVPEELAKRNAEEIIGYLNPKIIEMTNAGILKFILNLENIESINLYLIKILVATISKCSLTRRCLRVVANPDFEKEFNAIDEIGDISVDSTIEKAMHALGSG